MFVERIFMIITGPVIMSIRIVMMRIFKIIT